MFNNNLSFFPSFFFLDRYWFFLNITFLVESVFSFFFSWMLTGFFSWSLSWSKACFLSFYFLFSFMIPPLLWQNKEMFHRKKILQFSHYTLYILERPKQAIESLLWNVCVSLNRQRDQSFGILLAPVNWIRMDNMRINIYCVNVLLFECMSDDVNQFNVPFHSIYHHL